MKCFTKVGFVVFMGIAMVLSFAGTSQAAPVGTAFTYQGRLTDDGAPATGNYDFQFTLYDSSNGGSLVVGPLFALNQSVQDGYFTVPLDFGSVFRGDASWLAIEVRPAGVGSYTLLKPLQPVTPTPNALYAKVAGSVSGGIGIDGSGTANTIPKFATASTLEDSVIYQDSDNIGIGTNTPATKLDVTGSLHMDAASGYKAIEIEQFGNGPYIGIDLDIVTATDFGYGLNANTTAGAANTSDLHGIINYVTHEGLSGTTYGIFSSAYGSTAGDSYGIYSYLSGGDGEIRGINTSATCASTNTSNFYGIRNWGRHNGTEGTTYGIHSDITGSDTGRTYGIYNAIVAGDDLSYGDYTWLRNSDTSTSDITGIFTDSRHSGPSGITRGFYSHVYGSDTGDTYGILADARKFDTDTAGQVYGGYFIADNDRDGGRSYAVYAETKGENGPEYGVYAKVEDTTPSNYSNYGMFSKVLTDNGYAYGFYADVDTDDYARGLYLDVDVTNSSGEDAKGIYASVVNGGEGTTYGIDNHVSKVSGSSTTYGIDSDVTCGGTGSLYGVYSFATHTGTAGTVSGIRSIVHSSDSGITYAGRFSSYSSPGDTGVLYGIYASCDSDTSGTIYAGYFHGNVHVNGTLSKSAGSFKIDHPLDPENKYLYHSFVESPDMKNVYDGVAVLDEKGKANVVLPEYFEALNRDFRYQLTPIGAPGPHLYIADEVANNSFTIAGGEPGMKVSWQVTGIRQDAYAEANRIPVEEDKPGPERGLYLHPKVHGLSKDVGIETLHEINEKEE